jgi:hypothetical protein
VSAGKGRARIDEAHNEIAYVEEIIFDRYAPPSHRYTAVCSESNPDGNGEGGCESHGATEDEAYDSWMDCHSFDYVEPYGNKISLGQAIFRLVMWVTGR